MADSAGVRSLSARVLPVPTTVSARLAQSIIDQAALPVAAFQRAPQTAEQWPPYIAAMKANSAGRLPALLQRLPCEIREETVGGVAVRRVTPPRLDPARAGRTYLHLHGGAYVFQGGEACVTEAVIFAHAAGVEVISVDYRMPPEHPYPAAVDDAEAVWRALIADRPAASIGVFGTSAGGGLLLAMVLRLKARGLPLPGALAPGTPWADLAGESDSYQVNAWVDGVLPYYPGVLEACARLYAGEAGLKHPEVSPVLGDLSGFPPSILTTGTRDILLSDTVRTHRALRAAGSVSQLEVYEALSHAEYNLVWDGPEGRSVFADIAAWFDRWLTAA